MNHFPRATGGRSGKIHKTERRAKMTKKGEFLRCPNCGNGKKGHNLAKCRDCGLIFCEVCCNEYDPGLLNRAFFHSGDVCSNCHENEAFKAKCNWEIIGKLV